MGNEIVQHDTRVEVALEGGHKVTLRKFLIARDYLRLKNFIVAKAELQTKQSGFTKSGSPKMVVEPKIDGETVVALEDETVKAYILAFDGSQEGAFDKMMSTLNGSEYEQVKDKIDELHFLQQKK